MFQLTIDKLPAQDLDAERAALGSVFLYPEAIDDLSRVIATADFYLDAHQRIFRSMLRVKSRGLPPDSLIVADDLQAHGQMEEIGGTRYLIKIMESIPHAAHAAHYAGIVREKAKLRNLVYHMTQALRDAYDSPTEADELLRDLEGKIGSLLDNANQRGCVTFSEGTMAFIESLERKEDDSRVIPTGFADLDRKLRGGLRPRKYIILGAGTSIGKTALVSNIATNIARQAHVLIFSLEMGAADCFERYIPSIVRIPLVEMKSRVESGDTGTLPERIHAMAGRQLSINDADRSLAAIQAQTRRSVHKCGTKLVIVDYLQLVVGNRNLPRLEQVAAISRSLQELAAELEITVLALSQVRRGAGEDGERLVLRDLKESGSIENDADVVLLLNRERDGNQAILEVAKHRSGELGLIELDWNGDLCLFQSVQPTWSGSEDYDPFNNPCAART